MQIRLIKTIAIVSVLSACTPHLEKLDPPQEVRDYSPKATYPDLVNIKQRLLLQIRGHEFDLVANLLVDQSKGFYGAAYTDAPASIFEFKYLENSSVSIIAKPDPIPEEAIKKGVLEDLAAIYLNKHTLIPIAKNTFVRTNKQNEVLAMITMEAKATNNDTTPPERIIIENKQFPYKLDIKLLELSTKVPKQARKVFE